MSQSYDTPVQIEITPSARMRVTLASGEIHEVSVGHALFHSKSDEGQITFVCLNEVLKPSYGFVIGDGEQFVSRLALMLRPEGAKLS